MKRHERTSSLVSLLDKRKPFPSKGTPGSPAQVFPVRRAQVLETIQSQQLRRPRSATPSSRRRKLPSSDVKVTKALLLILKERRELEAKKREIMLERRVRESVLNNRAAKNAKASKLSSSRLKKRRRARPRSAPLRRKQSTCGLLPLSRLKHHVPWEWYYKKNAIDATGEEKREDLGPRLETSQSATELATVGSKETGRGRAARQSRVNMKTPTNTSRRDTRPASASAVTFASSAKTASTFLTGLGMDDDDDDIRETDRNGKY